MSTRFPWLRKIPWIRLIGVLLLVVLLWRLDMAAVAQLVRSANPYLLAGAVVLNLPMVLLKSLRWLFRRRPDRALRGRRLPGLRRTRESPAKHADRAEFHCSREFIAAVAAGALGFRAHSPNRSHPRNSHRKQDDGSPTGAKGTSKTPVVPSLCCTSNRVLRYITALDRVSEQISCRPLSAASGVDSAFPKSRVAYPT